MNKGMIVLIAGLGGFVGGYLPVLLGASSFGGWSILGSSIGGLLGIWVGYKISN